jgi:DNA-binding beta-propeller fold protein YncE
MVCARWEINYGTTTPINRNYLAAKSRSMWLLFWLLCSTVSSTTTSNLASSLPRKLQATKNQIFSQIDDASRQLGLVDSMDITITTLAGTNGSIGSTNGMGTNSKYKFPFGVAISPDGVYALVADQGNRLIRKIIISTSSVTTFAGVEGPSGSTNGMGTNSQFFAPYGVSISPNGTFALVSDRDNQLIRKIVISTASVTNLAGKVLTSGCTNGIGTSSEFKNPRGVPISPDGSYALVADQGNHLIRKIIIATASVTTLAGVNGTTGATNGIGTIAKFNFPYDVAISPDGVYALVSENANHLIRKIIISTASVMTFAGSTPSGSTNGIGTLSKFKSPIGVSISNDGLFALIADYGNFLIRKIIISTASVSTLAGVALVSGSANGIGTNSLWWNPYGVAISPDGLSALVTDSGNHLIRKLQSPLPSSAPSYHPSSALPSAIPTTLPTVTPSPTLFGFAVKFGDNEILSSGKAILVDYLRDAKRGEIFPCLPSLPHSASYSLLSVSGKMLPISRIVNSSRVSSASDPPLSSDSILIKWRPVSAVSGIGSWEPSSSSGSRHRILSIPGGGVLVSWLVSLLSEEIKGFIIKGK